MSVTKRPPELDGVAVAAAAAAAAFVGAGAESVAVAAEMRLDEEDSNKSFGEGSAVDVANCWIVLLACCCVLTLMPISCAGGGVTVKALDEAEAPSNRRARDRFQQGIVVVLAQVSPRHEKL